MSDRTTTKIDQHGTFVHDDDLLGEALGRSRADLYTEVTAALSGQGITGLSKLRKFELAAMVADWATGTRDNERVADARMAGVTAAQKLARLQAQAPRHECGLSRQGIDCMCADAAEFDVDTDGQDFNELADEADPAAARREREATTPDILVDDAAADRLLNALYADGPAEVFHLVRVRFLAGDDQVMRVEGTTPGPVGTLVWLTPVGDDLMPARPAFPVAAGRLFRADVTALCHHAYTVNDSCPNCDAEDDEDGQTGRDVGRHALLTELGFATMVERRPAGYAPGLCVTPVDAGDTAYLETRR